MATYTAAVPVSGQSLGNSRPVINANFSAIQTTFDENHVDFNLANAGAHTHADLLSQASDPNPATGLVSHYSKAVSGVTEWFLQKENSGTVIQMSRGSPSVGSSGYTFLPGGLLLQWGLANTSPVGTFFTFPIAFTSNVFAVTIGGRASAAQSFAIGTPSLTGVTVYNQAGGGNQVAYIIAIGN